MKIHSAENDFRFGEKQRFSVLKVENRVGLRGNILLFE